MELNLALLAEDMHYSILPKAYAFYGQKIGIPVTFDICNVKEEQLKDTVERFRKTLHGFTVTMPYKVKIMDYCDYLDESAEKCGSANIVLNDDGRLIGYNTDGWGMVKFLELEGFDFQNKNVVMVGAGGVALSIAYNLSVHGVKSVKVLNIFEEETQRLISRMGPSFTGYPLNQETLTACTKNADCFINASVLGQIGYSDYENLDFLDGLKPGAVVFDVNYSNPSAKLYKAARDKGFLSYVGRNMSSCQGIRAMEIWTGVRILDEVAKEFADRMENGE